MKLDSINFNYKKMRIAAMAKDAKDEIVSAIENEVVDRMYKIVEAIGNMDIPLSSHATVRERDEKEIINQIGESLKKEEEYRTRGVFEKQDGDCFDMALKGSKAFLESHGHTLKKTFDLKRK